MTDKKNPNASALRGRPRSEKSRRSIVKATISIMESKGYEKLTIVDVARKAGVGKQTIYRWWQSKAELVIESVLEEIQEHVGAPDTGSMDGDLRGLLRSSFLRLRQKSSGKMLAGVLIAGKKDESTLALFRERFIESRRNVIRGLFNRHSDTGALKSNINIELIMDFIFGAMWYRLLMEHAPLDDNFADEVVDHILPLVLKQTPLESI